MSWPTLLDYHEAVQTPRTSFGDPELRDGTLAINALGLPLVASGSFASVYRMTCAGKAWAIRCFHENRPDQQHRYEAISRVPGFNELEFTVNFQYLKQGIKVNGSWFPILKMEWVDGETLDEILRKTTDAAKLRQLADKFRRMIVSMHRAGIAHGDLQHGNIMMVRDQFRLVDYDCMFVPELSGHRSPEIGHRNYQHPYRSSAHFGPYLDNFSAWLIQLSLDALSIDPALMRVANGGEECIIFRSADLRHPETSSILKALAHHGQADVRRGASILRKLLNCSVEILPSIEAPDEEIDSLPETLFEPFEDDPDFETSIIAGTTARYSGVAAKPRGQVDGISGLRRTISDAGHQAWFFVMSRVSPDSCVKALLWDAELLMGSDLDRSTEKLNDALDVCIANKLRKGLKAQVYLLLGYCQMLRGSIRHSEKLFDSAIRSGGPPQVLFESVLARALVCQVLGEEGKISGLLDKHFESGRLLSAVPIMRKRPVPEIRLLNEMLSSYAFWIYQNRARKDAAVQLCEVVLDSYRAEGVDLGLPEPLNILRLLSKAAFETQAFNVSAVCLEQIVQCCDDPIVLASSALDLALVYHHTALNYEGRAVQALDRLNPRQIYQLVKLSDPIFATNQAALGDVLRLKAQALESGTQTEKLMFRSAGAETPKQGAEAGSCEWQEWFHVAAFVYSAVQSERQLELADCFAAGGELIQADRILRKYRGKRGSAWDSLRVRTRAFVRSMIDDAVRAGRFIEVAELAHCYRLSDTSIQEHVNGLMTQAEKLAQEGNVREALPYYTACGIFYSYDKFTYANCLTMALRAAQIYDKYKAIIAIFENPISPLREIIPTAITRLVVQLERENKRQAALDVLTTTRLVPDPDRSARLLKEEMLALADEERVEDLLAVFERYNQDESNPGKAVCSLLLENGRAEMASLFARVHKINLTENGLAV